MKNNFWKNLTNSAVAIDTILDHKPILRENDPKQNILVEIKNLKQEFKSIKKTNLVYKDVSFNIYENERLGFLGTNGAGKSITVETICGIRKPAGGEIKYNFEYSKNNPYKHIGLQTQDLLFPKGLTVKDIIDFLLQLNNLDPFKMKDFNEMINIFQLGSIIDSKVQKLSGGQQQRLNVFLALLNKPKILFLDEFTTGLDIAIKNQLQDFILEYCKKNKITLVIVSHDIDSIETICDRIIILANKQIMIDLSKKTIIKKFKNVSNLLKDYIVY